MEKGKGTDLLVGGGKNANQEEREREKVNVCYLAFPPALKTVVKGGGELG